MILVIDNYDSFTYNLVHLLAESGAPCRVVHNDAIAAGDVPRLAPRGIVLSAGPGRPEHAGVTLDVIAHHHANVPMLGVCLGHQAIAASFGARVLPGDPPLHGKTSRVRHQGSGLFAGLPNPLTMGRYNSLLVQETSLPADLLVSARSERGEVMAIEHRHFPLHGIQFHPESVLSEHGAELLRNWLNQL